MAQTTYTPLAPTGYQSITATSSTAVSCTVPTPSNASTVTASNYAVFTAETAAVRWRDDGVAPVNATTGGFPLAVGALLQYDGKLSAIQFISQSGTATIHASYYRAS